MEVVVSGVLAVVSGIVWCSFRPWWLGRVVGEMIEVSMNYVLVLWCLDKKRYENRIG